MCVSGEQFSVADVSERRRLISLASGSSGNSILVQSGEIAGLIDSGIGVNRLRSELLTFGLRPRDLSFVYVTHEHIDHVRSVPALARVGVPVVTSAGTARAMLLETEWHRIEHGSRFECGGIEISAVRISHDAAEPLGAVVSFGGLTAAVFTDMGEWTELTVDAMNRADIIVVEANHNVEMLKRGPYPAHLKRRVLSNRGHLSNDDCGRLTDMVRTRSGKSPTIFLAHLSETNNSPQRATIDVAESGGWEQSGLTPLPRNRVFDLLSQKPAERRQPTEIQQTLFEYSHEPEM